MKYKTDIEIAQSTTLKPIVKRREYRKIISNSTVSIRQRWIYRC